MLESVRRGFSAVCSSLDVVQRGGAVLLLKVSAINIKEDVSGVCAKLHEIELSIQVTPGPPGPLSLAGPSLSPSFTRRLIGEFNQVG
jgi:hypothetical protein